MSASDRFAEGNVVEDLIAEEIENLWTHVSRGISDKWLGTLDIPLSAEIAMLKMRKIVAWAIFEHDGTLPPPPVVAEGDDVDNSLEKLTPDGEPATISIDPWARGAVSTRKAVANDMYRRDDEKGGSPRPPSVSSFRSSNTGKSSRKPGSTATGSRLGSRGGTGVGSAPQDPTGQIIDLGDDDGDYAHLDEQLYATLKNANKKAPTAVAVLANLPKGEFDEIEEAMLKAKKDFKGKRFILDATGKPMMLAPIKPESLPPFAIPLGLNITNGTAADLMRNQQQRGHQQQQKANDSKGDGDVGASKRKKKTIRVAGSREIDESHFKASYSLASTLAGTDRIPVVNPGVVVKSLNGPVKEGPMVPEDAKKMSRKAYFHRQASASQIGGMTMSRADTFGSLGTAGDQSLAIGFAEDDASLLPASMVHFQDMDAFEGSRKVGRAGGGDNQQGGGSADREDIGVKATGGQVELGVLPTKPSIQQMQNVMMLTGGTGLLRDRDLPQNMISPNERRHLAAPPPGQVIGHGLSVSSPEKQGSTFQNSVASDSSKQQKSLVSKVSNTNAGGTIKSERRDIIRQLF